MIKYWIRLQILLFLILASPALSFDFKDDLATLEQLAKAQDHQAIIEQTANLLSGNARPIAEQASLYTLRLAAITQSRQYDLAKPIVAPITHDVLPKLKDKSATLNLVRELAKLHLFSAEYKASSDIIKTYLSIADESIDPQLYFDLYYNLGVAYTRQGMQPEAVDTMLNLLSHYQNKQQPVPTRLYLGLGGIYYNMQMLDKAIDYTQIALDQVSEDNPMRPTLLSNISAMYIERKDFVSGEAALKEALASKVIEPNRLRSILINYGSMLIHLERFAEALDILDQALKVLAETNDKEGVPVTLKNIGQAHMMLGNFDQAKGYLQQAYDLFLQYDERQKRLELYPVLIENFEHLGETDQALKYMHEYKELSDTFMDADAQERINNSATAFELEKKEKELALLNLERAQQEKDEQFKTTIFVSLMVIGSIIIGFIIIAYRIKAKALVEVTNLSRRDPLTGIYNRRAITEFVDDEIVRSQRNDTDFGLLLLDLDHFKAINDTHGHECGDQALVHATNTFKSVLRQQDQLARWGGEEFIIVLPAIDPQGLAIVAEKVRAALEKSPLLCGGRNIRITASGGACMFAQHQNLHACMIAIDEALYKAKEDGRNQIQMAS